MNHYETLEDVADQDGVEVIEYPFESERIKGLYCDGTVAMSTNLRTNAEKSCVLAEELGHHYTSTGIIIDQRLTENRKQEYKARMWAYNKLIGLTGIVNAYEKGCRSRHEICEHLGVTEAFFQDALEAYRMKYGERVQLDNYLISFVPHLSVLESFGIG